VKKEARMPILSPEPAIHPSSLFDEGIPDSFLADRRWFVLHTRPRQEKCLVRRLVEQNVPCFLPLGRHRLQVAGRIMYSHTPLFPGYVFLLGGQEERVAALATHRVVRSLEVSDQQSLWRDLRQVYRLIASGTQVCSEQEFTPGTLVEITSGPFMGMRGTFVRSIAGNRFVVLVDFIHRGASVTLEDCTLFEVSP